MKQFKQLFPESILFESPGAPAQDNIQDKDSDEEITTYKPRVKGEEDFARIHKIVKIKHPVAGDDQFTGGGHKGNPYDHRLPGNKQARGEQGVVYQGSSKEAARGSAFHEPRQYTRHGEMKPIMQGSSRIHESRGDDDVAQDLNHLHGEKWEHYHKHFQYGHEDGESDMRMMMDSKWSQDERKMYRQGHKVGSRLIKNYHEDMMKHDPDYREHMKDFSGPKSYMVHESRQYTRHVDENNYLDHQYHKLPWRERRLKRQNLAKRKIPVYKLGYKDAHNKGIDPRYNHPEYMRGHHDGDYDHHHGEWDDYEDSVLAHDREDY